MKIIKIKRKVSPNGIKEILTFLGVPLMKKYRTTWEEKTYILGIKINTRQLQPSNKTLELENKLHVAELMIKSLEASLQDIKKFEEKLKLKFPDLKD